ncbi:MAG: YggU family protein [Armatimonadetes bacterium]|nr:YggU family protein [Armatimonadota bacterium]
MPTATLRLRVIPRARKDEIAGERDGALVVRLKAPPVEGAANKALLKFLASRIGVRPGDLEIVSGHQSRDKVVRVEGLSQSQVDAAVR